jgi:hypothetical protein
LKAMHDVSDEALCERWVENPYFCSAARSSSSTRRPHRGAARRGFGRQLRVARRPSTSDRRLEPPTDRYFTVDLLVSAPTMKPPPAASDRRRRFVEANKHMSRPTASRVQRRYSSALTPTFLSRVHGGIETSQDRDEFVPYLEFPQIRQGHPKQSRRRENQNPQREHRIDGKSVNREQWRPYDEILFRGRPSRRKLANPPSRQSPTQPSLGALIAMD